MTDYPEGDLPIPKYDRDEPKPDSDIDEILHALAEDVADKFGGDIYAHPQEYFENQAKQRLLALKQQWQTEARIEELKLLDSGEAVIANIDGVEYIDLKQLRTIRDRRLATLTKASEKEV